MLGGVNGGGDDTAVKRAEAKVTVKERALSKAQAEASAATAAFCRASKAHIVACKRSWSMRSLSRTPPLVQCSSTPRFRTT
jgi:hypothetical protein